MRLRSVFWLWLAGLAAAGVMRSPALAFATLAASAFAALMIVIRRRLYRGVSFERSLSRRVVPWGGRLEVALGVTNDKLLPLVWLRIRDRWPSGVEPLGFDLRRAYVLDSQELVQTFSLRWFERLRRRYRVRCVARGVHRFGPAGVQAGDPFGIGGVERVWEHDDEVVVLPRVLEVPALRLLLGRPLVDREATRSLAVDPTALRSVRPFRSGDALRTVNWKATARTGELHVNEFDPSSLTAVRLLLDLGSRRWSWEAAEPSLMELLCVVAASLAAAFAAAGYAVGLASNASGSGEHSLVDLGPAPGALPDVLEAVARLRPFIVRDFSSVVDSELEDDARGQECVVVSAGLRPAVWEAVARLRRDRPTTVVVVGGPQDGSGPAADLVVPAETDWREARALAFHM